jgi:glycosyltransferase involved in cell wall biosynthesis
MIAQIEHAARGAAGSVVLLSPNPMHDTGGGQRSAQLALELARRDRCVVFVAHGVVTETTDLGRRIAHRRIVHLQLEEWARTAGGALAALAAAGPLAALGQVPVRPWLDTLRHTRRLGGVSVFDLIDDWDSELGQGWYRAPLELRTARASDLLTASAPALVARLARAAERPVHLLPNAFNAAIFDRARAHPRPADLPEGPVALYVGSLWGGWMDWALVRAAASALPRIAFVFVGDHRGEGGELPPNCRFLGLKPQDELPGYLAHAAVGFLPWTASALTHATSPLKVYEYLAMGLPVVAPPLDALRGLPGVAAAGGAEAFAAALAERIARPPRTAEREAMEAFARESSWTTRVDRLLELVEGAAAERAQRARQRPSILSPILQWSSRWTK